MINSAATSTRRRPEITRGPFQSAASSNRRSLTVATDMKIKTRARLIAAAMTMMLVPTSPGAWAQARSGEADAHQSESTRRMADRLDEIWKKLGNRVIGTGLADPFLSRYFYQ